MCAQTVGTTPTGAPPPAGELQRAAAAGCVAAASAFEDDAHFARVKTHPRWPAMIDRFDAIVQQ